MRDSRSAIIVSRHIAASAASTTKKAGASTPPWRSGLTRVPDERRGENGIGSVWTFTAIDADTKLMPTWLIGKRDLATATRFLVDLGRRIEGRFQLTSDGAGFYQEAVAEAFGGWIDYEQLVKLYGSGGRYIGARQELISGAMDTDKINTTFVERENLNIRMNLRRYSRRTNAYSKRAYFLSCAFAIYVFHHNFVRPHMTQREDQDHPGDGRGIGRRAMDVWKHGRIGRSA